MIQVCRLLGVGNIGLSYSTLALFDKIYAKN